MRFLCTGKAGFLRGPHPYRVSSRTEGLAVSEPRRNALYSEGTSIVLGLIGAELWRFENGKHRVLTFAKRPIWRRRLVENVLFLRKYCSYSYKTLGDGALLVAQPQHQKIRKAIFCQKIAIPRPCPPLRPASFSDCFKLRAMGFAH